MIQLKRTWSFLKLYSQILMQTYFLLKHNTTRDPIAQENTHTQRHTDHVWSKMVTSTHCLALLLHFPSLVHIVDVGYLNIHIPQSIWIHSYGSNNHHPMTTSQFEALHLLFYLWLQTRSVEKHILFVGLLLVLKMQLDYFPLAPHVLRYLHQDQTKVILKIWPL